MKFLCAPDAYKESLSAAEAALAMATGIRRVHPDAQIMCLPLSDGGEGFGAVQAEHGGFTAITQRDVTGPTIELHQRVCATWYWQPATRTALIESAETQGLALVPSGSRNPARTTSYGTGQLISAALDRGARRIVVGLGGTGTCDGGAGAAAALGVRYTAGSVTLPATITGAKLPEIEHIDLAGLDPRLHECELIAAFDVAAPLLGPQGAAHLYAPQKGADPQTVRRLENALSHWASLLTAHTDLEFATLRGAGAAGGMGAGLAALLGAQLTSGAEWVLNAVNFDDHLAETDIVFTGEGRLDAQTGMGKVCAAVHQRAQRADVPVVALVGQQEPGLVLPPGLTVRTFGDGLPLSRALDEAPKHLAAATAASLLAPSGSVSETQ